MTKVWLIPGQVLVDVIMGIWGGFFCLLVVDLVSRFEGLPIPGSVCHSSSLPGSYSPFLWAAEQMLPFLVVGFLAFGLFGTLILVSQLKHIGVGELLVAGLAFLIALLFLLDATCCLLCRSYRPAPP